jgi:SAM-dependent methyltransferase
LRRRRLCKKLAAVNARAAPSRPAALAVDELHARNRSFYDSIWRRARLRHPRWFDTWPAVEAEIRGRPRLLEVGPGLRPRLPLESALFLDSSHEAVRKLARAGARALLGDASSLPFGAASFDLVCALDVIEHAREPRLALGEIERVLSAGGVLLVALPLHRAMWSEYDAIVGHALRYEPGDVEAVLASHGFRILKSAEFGILPRCRAMVKIGAWVLSRFRGPAVWFEDRLVLPLARLFQRPIRWSPGYTPSGKAAGVLLCCRKAERGLGREAAP